MVVLEKKLGIGDIASLSGQLAPLLVANDDIVVDANAVESIDIAALQVLVAFSNSVTAKSKSVRWLCASGIVPEMAQLADLQTHLTLDEEGEAVEESEAAEDDGLCPVF